MCMSLLLSLQCVLAQFHLEEVGMAFAHPTDSKIFGITVKDPDTCGYTLFIYKCSLKGFECTVSFLHVPIET